MSVFVVHVSERGRVSIGHIYTVQFMDQMGRGAGESCCMIDTEIRIIQLPCDVRSRRLKSV